MSKSDPQSTVVKLSIMMFLQFFVWGGWFTTLAPCLGGNGLGGIIGGAYGTAPLAAILAPLFLGIIADRFFPSEKIMGVLFLIGGVAMCAVPTLAHNPEQNSKAIYYLFLLHMLCYMPTLGLSNTVSFANITDSTAFPKIRVWGTIGWIAAGLFNGFMGWSTSLNMFYTAGVASVLLGGFSFVLPHTPPPAKGQPANLRALFMVDALSLFAKPAFAVFAICSTLICIPLAYYYGIAANYLVDVGFTEPASAMTIGQMSEIIFMILIPFFFRKLGVKWMILIGMLAWVARYLLFAVGAPDQVAWMMFLAIAVHGICYDFFFVTGFIYTENTAAPAVRGQAQSLLVFLTQGVGMFFGYKVAFGKFGETVTNHDTLSAVIGAAQPAQASTVMEKFTKMFSIGLPDFTAANPNLAASAAKMAEAPADSINHAIYDPIAAAVTGDPTKITQLLADTMGQWKTFWTLPAIMAGVIAVIFFVAFWDKSVPPTVIEATGDADKATNADKAANADAA